MSTRNPVLTRTVASTPANRATRCPRCQASPNAPCRGLAGQSLAGVHFQRTAANRRSFSAALHLLYAPLNSSQFSVLSSQRKCLCEN